MNDKTMSQWLYNWAFAGQLLMIAMATAATILVYIGMSGWAMGMLALMVFVGYFPIAAAFAAGTKSQGGG